MKLFNKAKGFTLIELAVVMVVTGTLAAVAAPKLTSVADGARGSTLKGLVAAMETTNESVYSKSMQDRTEAQENSSIEVGYDTLGTVFGYLKATPRNMSALADLGGFDLTEDEIPVYDDMSEESVYAVTLNDSGAVFITYANQEATDETGNCYVSYESANSKDEKPVLTVGISGC